MHSNIPKNSEVDAYSYIKNELEKLGWIVKNPARVPNGEVYKQNESLSNLEIKNVLIRDMPEAIIKLNECDLWVIESKRDKKDIDKALDEAKNQYAQKINKSTKIRCIIATGIAGNDTDGYTVINQYLHNNKWDTVLFNGKDKNTLLSKEQVNYLLINKTPNWLEFPDFPEEKYLSSAENINKILHNAGVNKNKRARFIAGLILSLSLNEEINLRTDNTTTLVKNINNLIEQKLNEVNKQHFFDFIKLEVPPSKENHIKYRRAIIEALKELQTLDIKNAMASGNDILGKFYEKFLKYGNGAKEIGIVLTPRHIAQFATEVLDIKYSDYIFDPACGTGGFLVAAFDYVKSNSNVSQIDTFKNYNIFGIEQDDEVVALALVNMIFRGDGRNNISEGNCFQKNILKINTGLYTSGKYEKRNGNQNDNPLITKVLMNPPFALKKGDEKESHFIDYALSQMQDGGMLFVIIPISVMIEASLKNWRKELLKNNTLLSVVTFPQDLFNPSASVGTIGVFVKKGIPHNFDSQKVFFVRITYDGYKMKKGKRIKNSKVPDMTLELKDELKAFMINQNLNFKDIPEVKKICLLDKNDKNIELVPENYIDGKIPTLEEIQNGIEDLIKSCACYIIKNK
ncbi:MULTISPECIES: class I SAM-dependent DNA methyltransferase [unclassified Rickettsia]|uniref:HsdM family class I SAM-dependent methyltransferase n=1 Tax=unclassified Rickettsia TaxID=114295 RepID=UPI0031334D8D